MTSKRIGSLLCLLLALAACGTATTPPVNGALSTATNLPTAPTVAASPVPGTPRITVKTADDQPVVEIKEEGQEITIAFARGGRTETVRGTTTGDKRRYRRADGTLVAEVAPSESGFKLRTADGQLLWKVKLELDAIKVSDNENNTNAFTLKVRGPDRIKVERETTDLGDVRLRAERHEVTVEDAAGIKQYQSNTDTLSSLYGVLLLRDVPETLRYIVMAELLARGR